mgnify:CR=1 FL=1
MPQTRQNIKIWKIDAPADEVAQLGGAGLVTDLQGSSGGVESGPTAVPVGEDRDVAGQGARVEGAAQPVLVGRVDETLRAEAIDRPVHHVPARHGPRLQAATGPLSASGEDQVIDRGGDFPGTLTYGTVG